MGYYVPKLNDNFEHYALSTAMSSQTVPWNGTTDSHGPDVWYPAAPLSSSGNASPTTAGISIGASDASAWWKTENPGYITSDITVYSAKIYGDDGVLFGAVNTDSVALDASIPTSQFGFVAGFLSNDFKYIVPGGSTYTAANFDPVDDEWYDVQLQIDPTDDGLVRIWIKNLTDDEFNDGDPLLLEFGDNGLGEDWLLPINLTEDSSPLVWDGWHAYGANDTVQIDSFRSFLFPYTDFDAYNLYIDDPDFGTADRPQLAFIPEPASLMLLSLATSLLLRRRT